MTAALRLPSRVLGAGLAAFLLAAALLLVRTELAAIPLALWVLSIAVAPPFPRWSYFLPIVNHGPRGRRAVALTFDDGPDPRTAPRLLALLAERRAPATFFVVGRRAAAHPEAIRALLDAGHELGNHSDTHDVLLATRSPARLRREIEGCERALAPHGVRPLAYRPPVGITSPPLRPVLRELGLRCVCFSCRPKDFGNRRIDDLAGRVLRRVKPGDIVLLHDQLPDPAKLEPWLAEVKRILDGLAEKGLETVSLSELLGEKVMARIEEGPGPGAGSAVGTGTAPVTGTDAAPATALGRVLDVAGLLLTVFYPVLVAVSVAFLGARSAALVLLALLAVTRARTLRRDLRRARTLAALGGSVALLLVLAAVLDDPRFLLAYPSLVNVVFLAQFAWSLRGTTMVERFARLEASDLSAPEIRYCRGVTITWCVFFALNGGAATALAMLAPQAVWAAYTGGVSYVLMGLLFAGEYVVRKARFGRFGPGLHDRILARLLRRAEEAP